MGQQVVHIELVLHQALGSGLCFLVILQRLRLLNQGKHIAHTKDTVCHAGRIERLQILELFAGALEVDGHTGDGQHRECRAAAGVTIRLGQDNAADANLFIEGLGHVDGFLTGHCIDNQQRLIDLHRLLDAHQLIHKLVINLQAACGIQNHNVIAVILCVGHRLLGDNLGLLGAQRKDWDTGLLTHHLQLLNGGRAVDIAGNQQRAAALTAVILAKLCGVGGFTVALQAAHHQHGLALVFQAQDFRLIAAHEVGQLFIDDFDNLLGGGQAFHDLLPHGALRNLCAEVLGNLVVDIGLQQGHAHLTHGGLDISLVQLALAAQLFENAIQALC